MELTKLPNIGPELSRLLKEAEIQDSESLMAVGTESAFLRLKARDPAACFHKLTALEGAVQGIKKSQITPERKAELRRFFDSLSSSKKSKKEEKR